MKYAIEEFQTLEGYTDDGEIAKDEKGCALVSINKIAQRFKVDRSSLRIRLEGKISHQKTGRPTLLTEFEEQMLIELLRFRAILGTPMTAIQLRTAAKQLLEAKYQKAINDPTISTEMKAKLKASPKLPSIRWERDFMQKYKNEVGNRIAKLLDSSRLKAMSREKLDDFYDLLELCIEKTGLDPINYEIISKIIYNCDECGISLRPKQVKIILPRIIRNAFVIPEQKVFDYTTVLACGNAFGDILNPLIIYRNLPEVPENFKVWTGPLYRCSKSGWINSDLYIEWLTSIFIPEAQRLRPVDYEGPIILIFDGHSTHVNDRVMEIAFENRILLLQLPSHSTHVLQPLDLNFFGPLKNVLGKIIREKTSSVSDLAKDKFSQFLLQAWNGIDNSWLKKGFAMSGILTQNGINRMAVSNEEIAKALPYLENGNRILQLTEQEISDLNFPEHLSELEAIRQQFKSAIQLHPLYEKQQISNYLRYVHFILNSLYL